MLGILMLLGLASGPKGGQTQHVSTTRTPPSVVQCCVAVLQRSSAAAQQKECCNADGLTNPKRQSQNHKRNK